MEINDEGQPVNSLPGKEQSTTDYFRTDQLTLRTCARTSLDSLGDSKGRFGIFTLGSTYHDSRLQLTTIGRTLDKEMKVTHSTAGSKKTALIF